MSKVSRALRKGRLYGFVPSEFPTELVREFVRSLSFETRYLRFISAVFVSGDDASARTAVVDLIERLGFAAVPLGGLVDGRAQQFGGGAGSDHAGTQ